MDSVIEVVANHLRIRGNDFHTRKNRHCPECDLDTIVFPKSRGSKKKNKSRGIKWRCSECGCAGFQTGYTVVVTRDRKQPEASDEPRLEIASFQYANLKRIPESRNITVWQNALQKKRLTASSLSLRPSISPLKVEKNVLPRPFKPLRCPRLALHLIAKPGSG
jgi:hypothetical protein